MIDWRFCGRFSDMSQDAFPPPYGWIDEAEARRRYHDPVGELTVLPPADPDTGIAPYFIVVGSGGAGFTIVEQIPPGVPKEEYYWQTTDGRLFCTIALFNEYPETAKIITRSTDWRTRWVEARNNTNGTGSIMMCDKDLQGQIHTMHGKRADIPVDDLYRPIPEWGHWDDLLKPPPGFQPDTRDQPHPGQ